MAYDVWNTCFFFPGIDTAACAAWAQAWGTLLAIAGAAAIGSYQLRQARRLKADQRADMLQALFVILEQLSSGAQDWIGASVGTDTERQQRSSSMFREAAEVIANFPLDQVLVPTAVEALLFARRQIATIHTAMETRFPRPENKREWSALLDGLLNLMLLAGHVKAEAAGLRSPRAKRRTT